MLAKSFLFWFCSWLYLWCSPLTYSSLGCLSPTLIRMAPIPRDAPHPSYMSRFRFQGCHCLGIGKSLPLLAIVSRKAWRCLVCIFGSSEHQIRSCKDHSNIFSLLRCFPKLKLKYELYWLILLRYYHFRNPQWVEHYEFTLIVFLSLDIIKKIGTVECKIH